MGTIRVETKWEDIPVNAKPCHRGHARNPKNVLVKDKVLPSGRVVPYLNCRPCERDRRAKSRAMGGK